MQAPLAEKIEQQLINHGHTRIDNYYWLNNRENKKVIEYLEAENEYCKSNMASSKELEDTLFNEIVGRIKQNDESVPYKYNKYWYYTRYEDKKEYPIYCRKKESLEATEEIILDVNILAQGKEYCHVTGLSISPNNSVLIYGIDYVSRRMYTLHAKNLVTNQTFDFVIENTTGSAIWANDNVTFFYTSKDSKTLRSDKIYKHKINALHNLPDLVYTEPDEVFGTSVYKTKSEQYIIIANYSKTSNEYLYLDANLPNSSFTMLQKRLPNIEYTVDHFDDKFYIVTNYNAENFRLMETLTNTPAIENWTEIIPHRSDVLLVDIEIFKKYLIVLERKNGLKQIRVINWESKNEHYLNFGEEAYTASIGTNPDFNSNYLRYNYSSLTTPSSVIDYELDTRKKELKKQQEVVGGFNPTDYEGKRLYVTSRDGLQIPISIVYKKGIELNGSNPLLLYGYGSYGICVEPSFSSVRLSLLNRGFIFVIAHIRGGEEMGREWYNTGKFLKKENTFNDFIDCAEFLIENKYTNPNKLFAMGGSAGGLLIGAVINKRPELFKGVIAAVPFVDVVTTMLDESIPLTTGEYVEWGNPNDETYYRYMLSYSPYDNVKAQAYPAMLVTTGLHDSQVQYWEPAKWVAKLRSYKTDNNLLLLHTNMSAGHGGASGRFEVYRETALEYAFLLKMLKQ